MKLNLNEINIPLIFKRLCLSGVLCVFILLLLQQVTNRVKLKPLKGYFIQKKCSDISAAGWFSGDYQSGTEAFLNEGFGFRNFLVRLDNEIRFLLFKKTNTESVIIGKENFLYEHCYLLAYNGKDFVGENAINDTVAKIKFLQDTLNSLGKKLLIVIAPSKARIYPEYISDSLNSGPEHATNYMFYKKYFNAAGVNYIDFNAIFQNKKSDSPYLLFPQLGIHWSRLEAVNAIDTIIKRLGDLSGAHLPEIVIRSVKEKRELEEPDDDIVNSMNLLFLPQFKKMGYPEFEINKTNKNLKNLMMVADSYWWDVFLRQIPKNIFADNEFWYYNKEIWGNGFMGKLNADSVDMKRRILQKDYIVIMATESNLYRLGYGFIGQAISALKNPISPTQKELIDIKNNIQNNKNWLGQIIEKAKAKNISIEEMMDLDANWYFQFHGPILQDLTLSDYKQLVYSSKNWIDEVTIKAEEKKISLDSAVTMDARWKMNQDLNNSAFNQPTVQSIEKVKESILHNYEWMEQIREKAKKRGISVDSMISIDAQWFIEHQKAKN